MTEGIKTPVLRSKASKKISSNPEQQRLATLRSAQEAIEANPQACHGILELLRPEIAAEAGPIERSKCNYDLDWVEPRKRSYNPDGVLTLFYMLVKRFLEQAGSRPHDRSRPAFCAWLRAGITNPDKLSIVRLLLDGDPAGDAIKNMGDRTLQDCFHMMKAEYFSKNVQS